VNMVPPVGHLTTTSSVAWTGTRAGSLGGASCIWGHPSTPAGRKKAGERKSSSFTGFLITAIA
jgi:hypothetical protein